MRNQVFISYRQESPEHARNVRRLGELLRGAGLPVVLDQFLAEKQPGGPHQKHLDTILLLAGGNPAAMAYRCNLTSTLISAN